MEKTTYEITIVRPAGNDTALVSGIPTVDQRKKINDAIMQRFPNVEQVGFYAINPETKETKLEMAGGEFCGNATRALAYLLLNGVKNTLILSVSSVNRPLVAGSKKDGTSFAEMPIYTDFSSVNTISDDLIKVSLQGITHLVTTKYATLEDEDLLKKKAKALLVEQKLTNTVPAAGVMFIKKEKNQTTIRPVVWVRSIKTFFYETACASGTTAVGLWEAKKTNRSLFEASYIQPSGQCISVKISKNKERFISAYIDGPVILLERSEVCLEKD